MSRQLNDIKTDEEVKQMRSELWDILESGGDYEDVEDMMLGNGVEMDYLFDLI